MKKFLLYACSIMLFSFIPSAPSGVTKMVFDAAVTGGSGVITKVEFFEGSNLVHTENVAPYRFVFAVPVGTHSYTAKVFDNKGATAISKIVTVVIK